MQWALLEKAKLNGSIIYWADMRNAGLDNIKGLNETDNIRYANLEGTKGLLGFWEMNLLKPMLLEPNCQMTSKSSKH